MRIYLDDNNKILIITNKKIENIDVIIKDLNDNIIYFDNLTFNIDIGCWFLLNNNTYYSVGFKVELLDDSKILLFKTVFRFVRPQKNDYLFNRISKINDMYDDIEEVGYLKNIGYCDNYYDIIGYCYIHKWSRMLRIIKELKLLKKDNKFVEIGGGLSPIQFILANNGCFVYNFDMNFSHTWFPTIDNYYVNATEKFILESNKNLSNVNFINGNIYENIKNIENDSIDCAIDTCSIHTFIDDDPTSLMKEITRVLKPGGYFISVGDISNPYLGDESSIYKYPRDMKDILNKNEKLKLVEPYDYDIWEDELKDYDNLTGIKNVDFKNLSLINMKYDPNKRPLKGTCGSIYLWVATYIFKKN